MKPHSPSQKVEVPIDHPHSRLQAYRIRPARLADLDLVVQLQLGLQEHLEASNPDVWRMTPEALEQLRGQASSRLEARNACALVAEHDSDGIVGFIFGRVVTNKRYAPTCTGTVDQVFVVERHRRSGVGTCLVAGLCRFFGERGIEDLSLRYVVGNEAATGFWERLGFAPRIAVVGATREMVEARLLGESGEEIYER